MVSISMFFKLTLGFIRGENGELCVGVRRKVYQQSCGGLSKAASCGQNKQVVSVTTNCALLKGTIFSVHYDARYM